MGGEVEPADYLALLDLVKQEIAGSRVRAARAVNSELIGMYWRIGALIRARQAEQGWGARVVDRLSTDLRTSFPDARGLSRRNLLYMRAFAGAWPEIVQQVAAQLPWSHVMVLLNRLDDQVEREWYAARDAEQGWSRAVLETMIASRLHLRQGMAPSNFPATTPWRAPTPTSCRRSPVIQGDRRDRDRRHRCRRRQRRPPRQRHPRPGPGAHRGPVPELTTSGGGGSHCMVVPVVVPSRYDLSRETHDLRSC